MATVPVTVVAKKPWAEYDSAVAYMQDIETGSLLQSIHDGVRNLTELEHYIPLALIYAKPVRDLEFNDGVRPNDVKSFGSKSLWENIQSCLVYITGNEVPHAGGKHSCIKKFRRIVVPKLVYDYHFEDPDNLRKKFEKSKHWACANHHYDCEWSRCEAWALLGLSNPKVPRGRARATALPQTDFPQPAIPQPSVRQHAALQPVVPQSVAPQYLGSQTIAAQPVASHTSHAQPVGQGILNHQLNGRGALPGPRRSPSRGAASGGISSRRSTQVASVSDHVRQNMLAHVSGGFNTQSQHSALSSAGSAGADFQTSGSMAASYQMSPYQTPYHTHPVQRTFDAMQSPLQVAAPPGSFTQEPLSQSRTLATPWSHSPNLQYSPMGHNSQGFGVINHQPNLVTGWDSQLGRSQENSHSALAHQLPVDRTVGLLEPSSQGAPFHEQPQQTFPQQFAPQYVDPRQIMRRQTPQHGGQVSDATILQQQVTPRQVVDSADGGIQDPTAPSPQDNDTVSPEINAAETPPASEQSYEDSREAENTATILASSHQSRINVDQQETSQGEDMDLCQ